jgi:hypothetical protein
MATSMLAQRESGFLVRFRILNLHKVENLDHVLHTLVLEHATRDALLKFQAALVLRIAAIAVLRRAV